jgi:protein gp37
VNPSNIAWCHYTHNFWIGCHHVSGECAGCYAEEDTNKKHKVPFHIVRRTSSDYWNTAYRAEEQAAKKGKSALVFTCSYSDFFHKDADAWRPAAWDVIRATPNLIWLILTKRPERIKASLPEDWGQGWANAWLGVTVGMRSSYHRLETLREIPAAKKFISIEPLLESLADINMSSFDWALVGGMSGDLWHEKRMRIEWAKEIYEASRKQGVKYLFKQASAPRSECGIDALGRLLGRQDGDCVREFPISLDKMLPLDVNAGKGMTDEQWEAYLAGLYPKPKLVQISGSAK